MTVAKDTLAQKFSLIGIQGANVANVRPQSN